MIGKEKFSWPEIVGTDGEVAASIIKSKHPTLKVYILPPVAWGTYHPMLNLNRVLLRVHEHGIVTLLPGRG
ncbi:hypothetical protein CerSpe_003370 [Prunus speciosa]